jgi:beta-N-acetylhexosaminidase
VLAAGSDLALHCNGVLAEMEQVAEAAPSLSGDALRRFNNALQVLKRREDYDTAAAERHLSLALGTAGRGTESV